MHSNFYTTIFLLLIMSIGLVVTDIYLPSLPMLSVYFHANDNEVQMTLFSYLLSFSLAPLIFGPLSDHMGRKKIILCGLLISIVATFSCMFSPNIQSFIFSRFLQGIGMGAVLIASRAIISDLFTGQALARQMSLTVMLMPLFLAMAPTIGGMLQERFCWQAIFIFLIFYMLFIFTCVCLRPESLKHFSDKKISQTFSIYKSHLRNRLFIAFGINFILPSFGMFAYLTVSPFLFQEVIGLSPTEYGTLAIYIGGVILSTGYINLKLLRIFSAVQILYAGVFSISLAGGLLLFFHMINVLTTWSLLFPILIFFTCMPLCVSNAVSKAMSLVKSHFGAASALLTTFQFLTGALGSFIFSLISDDTVLPLALCFIFIGGVSFINLTYAQKLEKSQGIQNLDEVLQAVSTPL